MTWVVLELVPLMGENDFEPRPQHKLLIPFRGVFKHFRRAPRFFCVCVCFFLGGGSTAGASGRGRGKRRHRSTNWLNQYVVLDTEFTFTL